MTGYADFRYYQEVYGGRCVPEEAFAPLSLRASALADRLTFGRAYECDPVRLAVCAGVDALYRETQGIASEQNDGYSVTYVQEDGHRRAAAVMREFLPPEMTNRGCWA